MDESKRKLDMHILKPGEQIPVDITNATRKTCECGSEYFIPVLELYIVSALVSPIGKEMLAQKPALVCLKCQKPLNLKSEGDDGVGK